MINEHADELWEASLLKRRRKAKKMIRKNAIEIESPEGMEKLIDEYVTIMLDEEELKRNEEMEKYDNEDFEEELHKLLIQQEKEWNDQEKHENQTEINKTMKTVVDVNKDTFIC